MAVHRLKAQVFLLELLRVASRHLVLHVLGKSLHHCARYRDMFELLVSIADLVDFFLAQLGPISRPSWYSSLIFVIFF